MQRVHLGIREDAEHGNYACHCTVNAEIRFSKSAYNHSRGKQPDQHQQQHTEIQKDRIACDPSAVFRYAVVTCHPELSVILNLLSF